MLIGAMHIRKNPNKISKLYTLAAAAKIEGVDFCYFSPGKVDFDTHTIKGFYYDGKWIEKEFQFPDIVINMTGPRTKKQKKNVSKLKKLIPFTESMIHNKQYINALFEKDPMFKNYLPECKKAKNKKTIINFLEKHEKIVLKPSVGSKGKSIYFISTINNKYKITFNNNEVIEDNLDRFDKLSLNKYLIQEFIVSESNEGLPADYRVHTQKNEKGKYVIATIYPRVGDRKNKVSNISQGGYTTSIKLFLKNQYGDEWLNIYNSLRLLGLQASEFLDKHYKNRLNQLGIDICINKNKKLYIIEANWRPGLPVLFSDNINHIKNLIKYCKYIVNS